MGRRADPENRAGKGSEQAELPQGVLTFLLTDIEASTRCGSVTVPPWDRPRPPAGADRPDGRRPRRPAHQGPGRGRLDALGVRQGERRGDGPAAAGPPCTPGRRSCATATTSGRRSTGPPGCAPWAGAARSCCPGRRPSWWPTSSPKGGWRTRLLALASGAACLGPRPPAGGGRRRARPGGGRAGAAPAELTHLEGAPRPATELDPEMARFRLFDAMTSCLRSAAASRGLVVVLDDLHWADRATLRDVEVDRRHPLSGTLAELFRQPSTSYLVCPAGTGATLAASSPT